MHNYEKFPLLDMNMSWSTEGYVKFVLFRKKGQQMKYIENDSNHTPVTL